MKTIFGIKGLAIDEYAALGFADGVTSCNEPYQWPIRDALLEKIDAALQAALTAAAPAPIRSGPARSSDQYTAGDMEEVGRRLMDALHDNRDSLKGWHPGDCPTEIVSDLLNARDEALAELATARAAVPAGGDGGLRTAMFDACDLLMERKQGSAARSPNHNARLVLERALAATSPPSEPSDGELRETVKGMDLLAMARTAGFSRSALHGVTHTVWKDSIDIDEPSSALVDFVIAAMREAARRAGGK